MVRRPPAGVSQSVVQQSPQRLGQPVGVARHVAGVGVAVGGEADPLGVEAWSGRCDRPEYQVLCQDQDRVQAQLAFVRPRYHGQVAHEPVQPLGLLSQRRQGRRVGGQDAVTDGLDRGLHRGLGRT